MVVVSYLFDSREDEWFVVGITVGANCQTYLLRPRILLEGLH